MAAGKPTTLYVEIEFTAGVWTDVTGSVNLNASSVTIQRGRASSVEDATPGTLSFTLDNSDGTFTPDNPLSTYYPNVTEGKRVRVRVTKSTTSTRFVGRIATIDPEYPQVPEDAVVRVTAVDLLGDLERYTMRPLVTEAATRQAGSVSYFPLTEPEGASFASAAYAYNASGQALTRLVPMGPGVVDWGRATGVGTDSASSVTLNPLAYLNGTGYGQAVKDISFFFSASEGATGTVLYAAYQDVNLSAAGYVSLYLNPDGYLRVTRVLDDGTVIYDGATAYGPKMADGGVYYIRWQDDAAGNQCRLYVNEELVTSGSITSPLAMYLSRISLGRPLAGTFSFSHLNIASSSGIGGGLYELARPSAGTLTQDALLGYVTDWTGVTVASSSSETRVVTPIATDGMSALELVQRVANNNPGRLVFDDYTAGEVVVGAAADTQSSTVALTVHVEDDAVGGIVTARQGSALVRYVTAANGQESVTVENADADAGDATVEATTASSTELEAVASRRLAEGAYQRLRVAKVTLDLATAENSRYADFFALTPGARVRVDGLPSTHFGVTRMDGYAEGWVEEIDLAGYRVTFDLSAADAPAASVFDTGRFGWGDGVCTASSLTSSATSVTLTWTGSSTLSTSAGDYPMDLDINGERVTISSAPAGGTSPRTVTITRGVAPTVARAHSAGDRVEVWDVARTS